MVRLEKKSFRSVLSAVGNTPVVELANLSRNPRVHILAKLEGCNPGGSVKDRPAHYMIKKAEESGELTPEKVILEATSGNMGIALAMIGAAKGYRVKLFMPECATLERQYVMSAYGAEMVLTPAKESTDGAIKRAHQTYQEAPHLYYMPNQFENPNNVIAHYETTGPEVYSQTQGEIDVFVAGMGTTGTLMGAGRYLKERRSGIRIVGVEPTIGHTIQGLKNMTESIVPPIYHPQELDEKIMVDDESAFAMAKLLVKKEGLFVGMSSGAAVVGSLRVAEQMESGTIVVILPDRGDRYLSTTLFRSICAKCPP